MKILIVSQHYYPDQFLINEIAPELVKLGHSVTIIAGLPNYPSGYVPKEYRHFKKRNETIKGVQVKRCGIISRKDSALRLFLNYISFVITASFKVLTAKRDYDVVYCYQLSPVTQAIPAILAAKLAGCRLMLYCLDIFPESVKSHVSENSFVYRMVAKLSKFIYNKCDKIAVTSPAFAEYLARVNSVPAESVVYIPQHSRKIELAKSAVAAKNGKTNYLFAGNIGYGQNMSVVVKAVAELRDLDNFLVHIVGDGSKLAEMQDEVKANGVEDKFVFYGRKPKEQMPEYYRLADVLLITLRGDNEVANTLPGKMQEYMSVGKPIVGSANGTVKEIIERTDIGICASANDFYGLAQAMKEMIEFPDKYKMCGKRAVDYFEENFSLPVHMQKLVGQLDSLVI